MQTLPSSSSTSPPSSNRNPKKTMQALHFIRLVSPLLRPSSSSSTSLRRRRRLVRRAAYASMAMAVGPRITWSRSILRRLRRRSRPPVPSPPNAPLPPTLELRRLVPGGNAMDLCTLLEESAQYIQCLSLQVSIMRSILDSSSPAKDKHGLF